MKKDTNELIYKQTHRHRRQIYGCQRGNKGERKIRSLRLIHTVLHINILIKQIINKDLWNSAQCYAAWRRGEFGGEWIHGYLSLSPLAIHLKLSQHC